MTGKDHIDVVVSKADADEALTLANFDIADLATLLVQMEPLFYPGKKKDRPVISLQLAEGSVVVRLTTLLQGVKTAEGILSLVHEHQSLEGLEQDTARAVMGLQDWAKKSGCEIRFRKKEGTVLLTLDPATQLKIPRETWYTVELYLRGTVVDAGGKHVSNIHLQTDDYGLVRIEVDPEYLAGLAENILYKKVEARVKGKRNLHTKELDLDEMKLISLRLLSPLGEPVSAYLEKLAKKASEHWKDVENIDRWLAEIRYGETTEE